MYRSAKKADRSKNDLHERDEGELERTGQPLCIYEPYFGEGVWPFLHRYSLYRGIGLVGCASFLPASFSMSEFESENRLICSLTIIP